MFSKIFFNTKDSVIHKSIAHVSWISTDTLTNFFSFIMLLFILVSCLSLDLLHDLFFHLSRVKQSLITHSIPVLSIFSSTTVREIPTYRPSQLVKAITSTASENKRGFQHPFAAIAFAHCKNRSQWSMSVVSTPFFVNFVIAA